MSSKIVPRVDPDLCDGCGLCINYCLTGALRLEKGKAVLNPDICDFDRICVPVCPEEAIAFEEIVE
jgi:MinD superfamily P-loop ATPase